MAMISVVQNVVVERKKLLSHQAMLDGISLVDRFGGGISRVQPGLDTVQEFRIETTGSGAQYSRPATVSLVTKSGTNVFHGAMFEFLRDSFLPPQCSHAARTGDDTLRTKTDVRRLQALHRYS